MSRTLHVIDQPAQLAEAAVLRLSVDAARLEPNADPEQHAWLLFGGEATRDAARSVGLRDDQYRLLPKPAGLHKLWPAALAKPKRWLDQAHRVVCWTEGAAQIASLLGCAHVTRRVAQAGLCPEAHQIIRQAQADLDASPGAERRALRERWGVEAGTTVVALLADRFDRLDATPAAMTLALTHEALRASNPEWADVRLLCHPLAKSRDDASVFSTLLGFDRLLIQDAATQTPWAVLSGCDVALAPCVGDAGLSVLWADAMGVPVVVPVDSPPPMLDRLHQVVAARSGKPRDLADALTQWRKSHSTHPAHR